MNKYKFNSLCHVQRKEQKRQDLKQKMTYKYFKGFANLICFQLLNEMKLGTNILSGSIKGRSSREKTPHFTRLHCHYVFWS